MNQRQIDILKQTLIIKDGHPVATSLKVAEAFNREHRTVLQAIRDMECSPQFRQQNFLQMAHFRANPVTGGQTESPCYEMTKNGFLFLAMGFTGQKAALLREGYIRAFDELATEIASGMARTREELTDRLMMVVSESARFGYDASFIPELVRYRRLGLTQEEIGRLFGMPARTVANWTKKIADAGVVLPVQHTRKTKTFFKNLHANAEKQLQLFPVGALR